MDSEFNYRKHVYERLNATVPQNMGLVLPLTQIVGWLKTCFNYTDCTQNHICIL